MEANDAGWRIPLKSLYKVNKDKVDIYFSLYNTNDSNFDFAEELSYFNNPDTNILYIRWVETYNIYRYQGIGREQFKKFCDAYSQSGIILAEPGFIKSVIVAQEEVEVGEQLTIMGKGYDTIDVLYKPYNLKGNDKDEFVNQIYFLESLGFRDTGYRSSCDNNIFIYRSEISERYIKTLIRNEHNF